MVCSHTVRSCHVGLRLTCSWQWTTSHTYKYAHIDNTHKHTHTHIFTHKYTHSYLCILCAYNHNHAMIHIPNIDKHIQANKCHGMSNYCMYKVFLIILHKLFNKVYCKRFTSNTYMHELVVFFSKLLPWASEIGGCLEELTVKKNCM